MYSQAKLLLTTSTSVQVDCVAKATLTQARRLVALGSFVGTVFGTVTWRALYTLRHGCKPGVTINTGPATETNGACGNGYNLSLF